MPRDTAFFLAIGEKCGLAPAALRDHVLGYVKRGIVSKYAVPEQIMFVEALDMTSVGKLDKKLMRDKYASVERRGVSAG